MTKEEARKHERKPAVLTIDWRIVGSEDIIWSWTDDISAGGLRVRTMTPPEEGATVDVAIEHVQDGGEREHLRIPARVAWVRLDEEFCGMGLAFQPEEETDRKRLAELLDELGKRQPTP